MVSRPHAQTRRMYPSPEAPKEEPAAEAQPAAAPAEPGQEASFEEYQDITFED
jgi:cell division initiation protein